MLEALLMLPLAVAMDPPDPAWTADFGVVDGELADRGRNPYFILEPGYQLVLDDGSERLTITVLDQTRVVDGVTTRVVEERETRDGRLIEVSRNFFAISTRTNSVFYFGEEVDIYRDGKLAGHEGAWLSGERKAVYGLMMPGETLLGARYYQEIAPGEAMDRAEIVGLDFAVDTPAGAFEHCLRTEETTPLEPGVKEYKAYAAGIGLVLDGDLKLVSHGRVAAGASLPPSVGDAFQQDVAWSPDGQWLAFSQYTGGMPYRPEQWGVYVIGADGTMTRQIVAKAKYVAWSPDGRQLAYGADRDGNEDLYITDPEGGGVERLTTDDAEDRQPAWSPDGTTIAFASTRDGSSGIYLVDVAGGDVTRLTDDPADDFNPQWSPDGASIVFYRETGDGHDQVWVVGADGSGERRVTDGSWHNTFPCFLPDGRIGLTCMHGEPPMSIVCMGPDGSGRVTVGEPGPFFARWSPDGRTIAFIQGRWPRSAIYLMDADGSNVRKVVN